MCQAAVNLDLLSSPRLSYDSVRAPPATTMPQISALLGGIVAQEAIKIITKQYIPLNGTSIFDGIKSVSESFTF